FLSRQKIMSTIFALSSGSLPAALAIFRLSGPRSKDALVQMTKKTIFKPRYMHYTKLYDSGGKLFDVAMAVHFPGPATYTGEDTSEIFIHGSKAIVERMSHTLSSLPGMRHASAGEFTKRALVNGKMNVHEVNALGALLQSSTPRQLNQAHRALAQGDWLQHSITRIRGKLAVLADFGEDVRSDPNEIRRDIQDLLNEIKDKRRKGTAGNRVRNGIRIVLVGRPNAGKSSLFNRLCGFDRAIVSSVPGTTRDSLEIKRLIGGINVTIEDTAGIHSSHDPIERQGIERTIQRMREADLIVVVKDVTDSSHVDTHIISLLPSHIPSLVVRNKADLLPSTPPLHHSEVYTVATSVNGCHSLENKLEEMVLEMCPPNAELTLSAGMDEVEKLVEECLSHDDIGLINEILQMASIGWGRAETNDQLISTIMQQFCIGK
ncbi:hypothetical protein PENTCL1PPCAC_22719, partial [Pristionchus entomophagus]